MHNPLRVAIVVATVTVLRCFPAPAGVPASPPTGYPITPVPFTAVKVDDRFWSPRLETNRTVTIPHVFRMCEETGRIRNFQIADSILTGRIDSGRFCSRYGFDDSDVFKSIEAASYSLHTRYDEQLDRYLDTLIHRISRAQEQDGYLYTMRTINPRVSWANERWVNDRTKSSHELYNVGHLYEAAVAHFAATGKRSLLEVALRSADLLVKTFGPDRMHTVPGHQVTEIGLAKLFLVTGERKYLELAKFFIDERGRSTPHGEVYNQDHLPVSEQTEAVGHAVRAAYFYAGIADVASLLGETSLIRVIDRLWEDVVTKKLYVTGGIGSAGDIEGFGPPYELANHSAYCETCASIANVYWNFRMFLLHGDARYLDVMERVIYNGVLPGVSLQGDRFFYPNPLSSISGRDRTPWFTCACCPPNVARFIPSIPGYVYALCRDTVFVNLFVGGTAAAAVNGVNVAIAQSGGYPWEGNVAIRVDPARAIPFVLKVRIPGWAYGHPVPGDLYRYVGASTEPVRIAVNGKSVPVKMDRGFAAIGRVWSQGDRVELSLPVTPRRTVAHPKVEANRGRVALERGPIVYCLEGLDQPAGWVFDLQIPDTAAIRNEFREGVLGGVTVLRGMASRFRQEKGGVVRDAGEFTAIPYYAWAHRGRAQMTVWPAREIAAVHPQPEPTLASRSKVTASAGAAREAINDLFDPDSSAGHAFPYLHWWPRKGTTEWVQYEFPGPVPVSTVEVYWYDDTATGECRLPASWKVMFREGGAWKPVSPQASAPPVKDRFTVLSFTPVTTDALRLEITSREGFAAGIHEWKVR
jgi:uncharacterized protein